ncbi:Ig-like domain-containing protein [Pseudomonas fluorescens]|uniref:Ig-like domain-containing protein n=1 Tax=Pseudomonas fluorescens TaxID=294 RepID=UPI001241E472|nr:Ig-like domain-containing protein [Pseudomonas fluorescens]
MLLSSTVLGTAVADGTGNWSITSSTLSLGVHTLTAKQIDQAGNVSAASVSLALTVEARPTPASPPATTPLIDGVAVPQHQVSLPGGGSGTQIIVPMVSIDRTDSSGSTGVADNSASSDDRVENHEG